MTSRTRSRHTENRILLMMLYVSTLIVNVGASEVIRRSRSGAGVEI